MRHLYRATGLVRSRTSPALLPSACRLQPQPAALPATAHQTATFHAKPAATAAAAVLARLSSSAQLPLVCARPSARGVRRAWRSPSVLHGAGSSWRTVATAPSSGAPSGLSISHGPSEPPLFAGTIPQHFASIVERFGDRPAVISRAPVASPDAVAIAPPRETVYTYAGLDRASDVLARGLQTAAGVKRGDRVALSLGNGPQFAALTYALFKIGAVLVPLNPAFTATQVAAALDHLGVELLIIGAVTDMAYKPGRGRSNLALLKSIVADLSSPVVSSVSVPSLQRIVLVDNTADHPAVMGAGDFAHFQERLPALIPFEALTDGRDILQPDADFGPDIAGTEAVAYSRPDPPLDPSDTINIQFTSGTTSQPKAAMLSHTAILNNGALIGNRMCLTPEDLVVCPPPLFHCFGCVLGYMATATTGAAILFPSPAFDPVASLQMSAAHRATGLYGVSTMYVAMLEHVEAALEYGQQSQRHHHHHIHSHNAPVLPPEQAAALSTHLRTGIAAGSSVPEALMRRLFKILGLHELVICYGMTETAPVSCMTAPADPFLKRTSTVGRVMPHTAVKIVDPEDPEKIVPRGQPGELAASGYLVMAGYYGDEEQTASVIQVDPEDPGRRWMMTGDEATMDEDGYVAVTGRIKDLIIRGGENIHPLEVENCLFQHPLVAEVSVVGVPDERYGEVVGAFVIPHAGVRVSGGVTVDPAPEEPETEEGEEEEALTDESVRQFVGERMSKHLVPKHVFWTAEYPKTASGKIQKFKLRDMAKKILSS